MMATKLQELEDMGAKLQAAIRKVPLGLTAIACFRTPDRAQIVAMRSTDLRAERQGLKAKGK